MAHKTLIGGTAYEISGGKTLINGTAYSIKNGKTLVGGTAYDVGFVKMHTVYIDRTALGQSDENTGVYIDGQFYNGESSTEIIVQEGTVIECVGVGTTFADAYIYVNNIIVEEGSNLTYRHTVDSDTYILCGKFFGSTIYIANDGLFMFSATLDHVAVDGMTWEDWCPSELNTSNLQCKDGIVQNGTAFVTKNDGTLVKPTDVIIPMYKYSFMSL